MRHALRLQEVTETLKGVLLEAAEDELQRTQNSTSASRLSIMTGVHRIDVARLRRQGSIPKQPHDKLIRVLGRWQADRRFRTKSGKARTLTFEGEGSEFARLVHAASLDLNPYTILFELERTGAVQRTRQGLKLLSRSYIARGDAEKGFEMLGRDADDLVRSVEENLLGDHAVPNLHLKTEYDRIPVESVPALKEWIVRRGAAFHQELRNFLARHDLDFSPHRSRQATVARIAVGTFSYTSTSTESPEEKV